MVMDKSLQTYGGTQGDICPTLARDIHNGSLSNYIFPPSPGLGQIEASFVIVNEQGRLCSCIIVNKSLLQKMHTLYFEYGPTENTGLQCLHIHTRMEVGIGLGQTHCCQNYKLQTR